MRNLIDRPIPLFFLNPLFLPLWFLVSVVKKMRVLVLQVLAKDLTTEDLKPQRKTERKREREKKNLFVNS